MLVKGAPMGPHLLTLTKYILSMDLLTTSLETQCVYNNRMLGKVCDEITYSFPMSNGATVELYNGHNHLSMLGLV